MVLRSPILLDGNRLALHGPWGRPRTMPWRSVVPAYATSRPARHIWHASKLDYPTWTVAGRHLGQRRCWKQLVKLIKSRRAYRFRCWVARHRCNNPPGRVPNPLYGFPPLSPGRRACHPGGDGAGPAGHCHCRGQFPESGRRVVMTALVPIAAWVLTPANRPFRWSRLFGTYLMPVIPAADLFDGMVRAYGSTPRMRCWRWHEKSAGRSTIGSPGSNNRPGRRFPSRT